MKRNTAVLGGLALAALGLVSTATAGVIDLSVAGTPPITAANGVIFAQNNTQPAGTGVFDPFLRLQNNGTETGINTSLDTPNQPILDDKPTTGSLNWTHDVAMSSLQSVTMNGTAYYVFGLDINQTGSNPLLSLDTIKFYVTSQITSVSAFNSFFNISGANNNQLGNGHVPAGGIPPATFDALGGNSYVKLNYNVSSGGLGISDMLMYVPVSDLPDLPGGGGYLYLMNQNGAEFASNDGFEQWNVMTGTTPPVPDSATTMMLLGMVFVGVEGLRRKLAA